MSDEYPVLKLDLNGTPFEITPANAHLYTFVGHTALPTGEVIENASRNHVFLKTGESKVNDEGQEVSTGTYIFGDVVARMGAVLLQHQFPADLFRRSIHPADEAAYQQWIDQQAAGEEAPDVIPSDWLTDDGS